MKSRPHRAPHCLSHGRFARVLRVMRQNAEVFLSVSRPGFANLAMSLSYGASIFTTVVNPHLAGSETSFEIVRSIAAARTTIGSSPSVVAFYGAFITTSMPLRGALLPLFLIPARGRLTDYHWRRVPTASIISVVQPSATRQRKTARLSLNRHLQADNGEGPSVRGSTALWRARRRSPAVGAGDQKSYEFSVVAPARALLCHARCVTSVASTSEQHRSSSSHSFSEDSRGPAQGMPNCSPRSGMDGTVEDRDASGGRSALPHSSTTLTSANTNPRRGGRRGKSPGSKGTSRPISLSSDTMQHPKTSRQGRRGKSRFIHGAERRALRGRHEPAPPTSPLDAGEVANLNVPSSRHHRPSNAPNSGEEVLTEWNEPRFATTPHRRETQCRSSDESPRPRSAPFSKNRATGASDKSDERCLPKRDMMGSSGATTGPQELRCDAHPLQPAVQTTDAEIFTNKGNPDGTALRHLMRTHRTFLKNYQFMQRSAKVAFALERLCAEALARGRVLEQIGTALQQCYASCDSSGDTNEKEDDVRLVLTGRFGTTTTLAAQPHLAMLDVPRSLVQMLSEPIVVPDLDFPTLLTAAGRFASMEKELDYEAANARLSAAAVGTVHRTQDMRQEALEMWYSAWGRQQWQQHRIDDDAYHCDARRASMSLWHQTQCSLQEALLSCFSEKASPSASSRPRESETTDVSPAVHNRGGSSMVAHVGRRPDHVVVEKIHEVLLCLLDLLHTLVDFRAAFEETQWQKDYRVAMSTEGHSETQAAGTYAHMCSVAALSLAGHGEVHSSGQEDASSPLHHATQAGASKNEEDRKVTNAISEAARQYIASIQKVDEIYSRDEPLENLLHRDNDAARKGATLSSSASTSLPSYAVSALDIWIGLLLRILLFYMPAFSSHQRREILQGCAAPWLREQEEQHARVAMWVTFFGLSDLFCPAPSSFSRDSRWSSPPTAAVAAALTKEGRQPSSLRDHGTVTCIFHVVQELRGLCWPSVENLSSSIVQRVLCLPPRCSAGVSSSSTPTVLLRPTSTPVKATLALEALESEPLPPSRGDVALSKSATAGTAVPPSPSPPSRPLLWKDTLSVLRGSAEKQRAGHRLLALLFGVLHCKGTFSTPPSLSATVMHTPEASSASPPAMYSSGSAIFVNAGVYPSGANRHNNRNLNRVFVYTLDADRFITENSRSSLGTPEEGVKHGWWLQTCALPSSTMTKPSAASGHFSSKLSCQMTVPYGLSRLAFCAMSVPLLQLWPTMSPQQAHFLMEGFQRAVARPAAKALQSVRVMAQSEKNAHSSSLAAREDFEHGARCPEWQAAAPVLIHFMAPRLAAPLWNTMWSYVSLQLHLLPAQTLESITASQRIISETSASKVDRTLEVDVPNVEDAVHVCCVRLSELSAMSAWLCLLAPLACGVPSSSPLVTGSPTTPDAASIVGYTSRVKMEFARCVKGVLAVWTQTDVDAAAADFLQMGGFPEASSADAQEGAAPRFPVLARTPPRATTQIRSVKATLSHNEEEEATLLWSMGQAMQAHVWTSSLQNLVREWAVKTRLVQIQSLGLTGAAELPPGPAVDAGRAAQVGSHRSSMETTEQYGVSSMALGSISDSDLLRWWGVLAKEDVGLPSATVFLAEVYTVLSRIVSERFLELPPDEEGISAVRKAEGTLEQAVDDAPAPFLKDACGGSEAATRNEENTSKQRGSPRLCVFTAPELVVILRMLSSIATRSGFEENYDEDNDSSITGSKSRTLMGSSSSVTRESNFTHSASGNLTVLDAIRNIALQMARIENAQRAVVTPASTANKFDGVVTERLTAESHGRRSERPGGETILAAGVTTSPSKTPEKDVKFSSATAELALQRLERALLDSLYFQIGELPASSLVEAVWLRLCPLSVLCDFVSSASSSLTDDEATPTQEDSSLLARQQNRALSSPPTFLVSSERAAASLSSIRLQGTLRESPSAWLRVLHDKVAASGHTLHVCAHLLHRNYRMLAVRGDHGAGVFKAATGGGNPASSEQTASKASILCQVSTDLTELAGFLVQLRASCAESLARAMTTREGSVSEAAHGGQKLHQAAMTDAKTLIDDGACASAKISRSKNPASVPVKGDGAVCESTSFNEEDETPLLGLTRVKEHGRLFSCVLVLASELDARLSEQAIESQRGEPIRGLQQNASQTASLCLLLYASLLKTARAFLSCGLHQHCTEVLQMVSMITWRMRAQHLLSVSPPAIPLTGSRRASEGEKKSQRMQCDTRFRGEDEVSIDPANPNVGHLNGASLLRDFRALANAFMPHVDAEALWKSSSRDPSILKMAVMISMRAALQHALHDLPGDPAPLTPSSRSTSHHTISSSLTATHGAGPAEGAPSSAAPVPAVHSSLKTLQPRPFWFQVPSLALLQRLSTDRRLVAQHFILFCELAIVAPEVSPAILPVMNFIREMFHLPDMQSTSQVRVVLDAITAAAAYFQARNREEMFADNHRPRLAGSSTVATDVRSLQSDGSGRGEDTLMMEWQCRKGSSTVEGSHLNKSAIPLFLPSLGSVRVAEMGALCDSNGRVPKPLPLFRSLGMIHRKRDTPHHLRLCWGSLARMLLEEEDNDTLWTSSLCVAALRAGATVGCAETHLFEQLLACLVEGSTQPSDTSRGVQRITQLPVREWAALLEACGTAVSYRHRERYRAVLRAPFMVFLDRSRFVSQVDDAPEDRVDASTPNDEHDSEPVMDLFPEMSVDFQSLPDQGAVLCGFLEAIPQLFIEDAEFWRLVKTWVESWCRFFEDAPAASDRTAPHFGTTMVPSHEHQEWIYQIQRCFNWSVRCAGHPLLVFHDAWTPTNDAKGAAEVLEWMAIQLKSVEPTAVSSMQPPARHSEVTPQRHSAVDAEV